MVFKYLMFKYNFKWKQTKIYIKNAEILILSTIFFKVKYNS